MENLHKNFTILMADDDSDDYCLLREALAERKIPGQLRLVSDGAELMDYLTHQGKFTTSGEAPKPQLILLDLNMPRVSGIQALMEIKAMSKTRDIPIIIFTTSSDPEDIRLSYQAGANSFITKPQTFEELLAIVDSLNSYWMNTVELPDGDDSYYQFKICPGRAH